MSKRKVFDDIVEGLNDAIEFARGNTKEGVKVHIPAEMDMKAIREALNLSQADFATTFGFSSSQVRDWEQGRFQPVGSSRAYLKVIKQNPRAVLEALAAR